MNSNSLSEPLTLWGLEDMIAVLPIECIAIRGRESREEMCVSFHEAVNCARTFRGSLFSLNEAQLEMVPGLCPVCLDTCRRATANADLNKET
jgi:hypothetical protein